MQNFLLFTPEVSPLHQNTGIKLKSNPKFKSIDPIIETPKFKLIDPLNQFFLNFLTISAKKKLNYLKLQLAEHELK